MPHAATNENPLQWLFFGVAGLFVLYQMGCGWQRGVMRQGFHLLALVCSYAAGWFGGPALVPSLRSLGYPDLVLSVLGGCILGLLVFAVLTLAGSIFFKKTAQHESRLARLGHGLGGSLLGMVVGLILVWGALVSIRVLGTFARSRIAADRAAAEKRYERTGEAPPRATPGFALSGLADMKDSLDHGIAGPVISDVDPLPPAAYMVINKMTAVLSDIDYARRFMDYPGARALVTNPKITALTADPTVVDQAKARNFMALMKNPSIVNALNDPTLFSMLQKFQFEKALDYALDTAQKQTPAGNGN